MAMFAETTNALGIGAGLFMVASEVARATGLGLIEAYDEVLITLQPHLYEDVPSSGPDVADIYINWTVETVSRIQAR